MERRRRLRGPWRHERPSGPWTSEAFNTIEGRFEIDGDSLKIVALTGRQHGEDTPLEMGRYDRPMDADVLKRQNENYGFRSGTEDGRRVFVLVLVLVLVLGKDRSQEMKYVAVER